MSSKNLTLILSLSLTTLLLAACGQEPVDPTGEQRGVISDNGPLKADGANSCKGLCGKKASTGCWCDEACALWGDCCPDKGAVCGAAAKTCSALKCAAGMHCELKGINGGSIPVCIKDATQTCANVKCAAGTHCELKGINGGSVPVCVNDPVITCANLKCASGYHCDDTVVNGSVVGCVKDATQTCADLGGHCLPLTYPMGQCAADEKADTTAGLCGGPGIVGTTNICCVKQPVQTCANVKCSSGYHCEMKGINGGAIPVCIKDQVAQDCTTFQCASGYHCEMKGINGGAVPVCLKDAQTCADLGGTCLPLTYPMGQCKAGEQADTTAGLCSGMPGQTTTCCHL